MENQQQNAAPQGAANGAACAFEQMMLARVVAGKMVGFTVCDHRRKEFTPVSQRAAVWLLQALEGKLECYEEGAVGAGRAVRLEYQYGTHQALLGTYPVLEVHDFFRGVAHYCKRKYKDAMRASRRAKRAKLAAEKGGQAA